MEARKPVRLAVAQFEDLVARGLRALVAEDVNVQLIADEVPHEQLEKLVAREAPDVALLNFGSLRSPNDVRALHSLHPETRLVVLANRPSPSECNQMLAFGATACLSKETQARDILSPIHLASRGLHVLPKTAKEFGMTVRSVQIWRARLGLDPRPIGAPPRGAKRGDGKRPPIDGR